jgi:hypothetical protein
MLSHTKILSLRVVAPPHISSVVLPHCATQLTRLTQWVVLADINSLVSFSDECKLFRASDGEFDSLRLTSTHGFGGTMIAARNLSIKDTSFSFN